MQAAAADDAAFKRNTRHIAAHEARPQPRPLPADAVTLAFEGCAYGKIVSEGQQRCVYAWTLHACWWHHGVCVLQLVPTHRHACPQVRELCGRNAAKAVVLARELLGAPLKRMQCIAAGITPALIKLLSVSASTAGADRCCSQ